MTCLISFYAQNGTPVFMTAKIAYIFPENTIIRQNIL